MTKPKKKSSRRWIWSAALFVLIIAGLLWGFRKQPVPADVVKVQRAPLRVTVEEEGKSRVRDRFVISAPVAGFVRRLPWKVGAAVRAGDAVAQLEPSRSQALDPRAREMSQARVQVAEAALRAAEQRTLTAEEQARAAQVDLAYWKQELVRVTRLRDSGDVPAERYDKTAFEGKRAEAAAKTAAQSAAAAKVDVDTAKAEVLAARAALAGGGAVGGELLTIRSPVSGRVLRVVRESEGAVTQGEPLLELANARALEVEVEVLSADAVKMGPGTRVLLTRWGGEAPLEGRVRVVEPAGFTKVSALGVEEQRVHVIADITSPEQLWTRLGDGYRVEASFILWEDNAALQAPAGALFRDGDGWAVFVVSGEVARKARIKIGQRNGLAAQVLSGLNEGDLVIAHPDDAIQDGTVVQPSLK